MPALAVHLKFCKGLGDFTTSPPDPAVDDAVTEPVTSLASIDDEGEGCGDGEVDCEPPPNKKRRKDGGFKQSLVPGPPPSCVTPSVLGVPAVASDGKGIAA